jgi:hypothetical protein
MEPIERRIIQALVATEGTTGETLWAQYEQASVLRRDFTGVGFSTYFTVPDAAPRLRDSRNPIGRLILIDLEGLQHGASAVLWVKDGVLDRLEVFTFTEPWPAEPVVRGISGGAGDLPREPLPRGW